MMVSTSTHSSRKTPREWEEYFIRMAGKSIRPMEYSDLETVVTLHQEAFKGYFLTSLGRGVLRLYYQALIESPLGIGMVFVYKGEVVGFDAGSFDPAQFYRQLLKSRLLQFGWYSLLAVLRRPRILSRLLRSTGARVTREHQNGMVELTSLAVKPAFQNVGCGVMLVASCTAEIRRRGGKRILAGVLKDNPGLLDAYYLLGWRQLAEVAKPEGDDVIEIYRDLEDNG